MLKKEKAQYSWYQSFTQQILLCIFYAPHGVPSTEEEQQLRKKKILLSWSSHSNVEEKKLQANKYAE